MIKSQIQKECIDHYYLIHIHLKCRKPIDDYECLSLAVFFCLIEISASDQAVCQTANNISKYIWLNSTLN